MTETGPAEAWNNVNSDVIRQFRGDTGKIFSGMFKGARLLLLTTKGAKSGNEPYHNVLANPEVVTHSVVRQFRAHARIAKGDERRRLYDAQAAVMPNFAEYQKKTQREIPVIVLEPQGQR